MNTTRYYKSALAVFLFIISLAARGEDAWADAAVKGLVAMNSGDGGSFVKITHSDHKTIMRDLLISRIRATPTSKDSIATLRDYGAASVADLESIPMDVMIKKMIYFMHHSIPVPTRTALKDAKLVPVGSEPRDDLYRVLINMTFVLDGKSAERRFVVLAKQEDGVWKYYGEEPRK